MCFARKGKYVPVLKSRFRAPAVLALEDGSCFHGASVGVEGKRVGEVVFNTSMTGYQEILTDPSYASQIVTLTYPHIGNTGVNEEDTEASGIWASGLVVRDLALTPSSWRAQDCMSDYMQSNDLVGMSGIDTRKLTNILRAKGSLRGCIVAGERAREFNAVQEAQAFPGLVGMDLARVVSCEEPSEWHEGAWHHGSGYEKRCGTGPRVIAYDYGIKRNILRQLTERNCSVRLVPAQTPASEALAQEPDGIFLSNGPGDPEPCDYAINAIKEFLDTGIPIFGICLGCQLLGLAGGAKTVKMRHGHHGANHPVRDLDTGRILITSQNHGFAIDKNSLPASLRPTHVSLFDGTLQGISFTTAKAFGFQGHPEASPGPQDASYLFDRFVDLMNSGLAVHSRAETH